MSSDDRWILGVDIGGTNVVVGAVPLAGGDATALHTVETGPPGDPEGVVERIRALGAACFRSLEEETGAGRDRIVGAGIGSPGPLDRSRGVVLDTPNLGWKDFPVRDRVAEVLELPAELDNDANCAVFGEWWLGAGRGVDHLVGLTLGTGIGGGIVLDGEILHGASDAAGEVGHMTVDFTGRRCKCGNEGCLEAYASGPNIAARAVEGIRSGNESILPQLVDGDLDRITAATVYEGLVLGDDFAHDVMTETARLLAVGVANLVNLLNPERVVIAGGVTRAGDHLFRPLRAEVRRRAFPSAAEACTIVPAALPETAGVVGAAGMFKKARFGEV